ncbi:DUF2201 family putative metallopeptidase [Billgrantia montanilacus]|uniref:Putative metallopeptidase domain-containing protein n=1 Tax=Billgrantia montanilacus TaxID=2282305 RepID=A0A368TYP2_9GAMM|nr:hypothetical protein [Halomonas montanilacus]RCV89848.1 hypothetical protein DU505_09695 [Halomonas montanilacus]
MAWITKPNDTTGHQHTTRQNRSEALRQWEADRRDWRTGQPASALLAEGLPIEEAPSGVATAATDGSRLLVNPNWSAGLDDTTRRFMQAHLVWHCAAGHFRLQPAPNADLRRWHLACDHEVNAALLMLGMHLPPQAVLFPACVGRPLPEVYAWLAGNPLLDDEHSLDATPWSAGTTAKSLTDSWPPRIHELVKRYLGSPQLPAPMASWLLNCW